MSTTKRTKAQRQWDAMLAKTTAGKQLAAKRDRRGAASNPSTPTIAESYAETVRKAAR